MTVKITHNHEALTITKVTDSQGSTSEVVLGPDEVRELIRYLNNVQLTPTAITYRLGVPR